MSTVTPSDYGPYDPSLYNRPADEVIIPNTPEFNDFVTDLFLDADASFILEDD